VGSGCSSTAVLILSPSSGSNYNHRALHTAAQEGHEAVVRLLLDRGADIKSKTENKKTALHLAAREGRTSVVQLLLDRGADVGATDEDGKTALDRAAKRRHEGIVELLGGRESMAQKILRSFNAA
jgi:ankyrin repeat protein